MLYILKCLNGISEWVGRCCAWLSLGAVLVMFTVVALQLFDMGSVALQESVMYLHGILFMLAAGYTLKHNGHVRVDIFYRNFSPRQKAWVEILGTCVLTIPVCVLILYMCYPYVELSWSLLEGSREQGGLPLLYVLKSVLLLMPALFMLQAVAQMLAAILYLLGHNPDWQSQHSAEGI